MLTTRIEELETHLDHTTRHFQSQLAEADTALETAADKLRTESDRCSRLESVAANQTARAFDLEGELTVVRSDLARLVNAITDTLGSPDEPAR